MLKEFKAFITRGNVLDLAVAVVLGGAFLAVVHSFADDILLQIVAALGGQPDFSSLTITVGDGVIRYGAFVTAVISFLIIAFAIFLVVKGINAAQSIGKDAGEDAPTPKSDEALLLEEIRDLLAARN